MFYEDIAISLRDILSCLSAYLEKDFAPSVCRAVVETLLYLHDTLKIAYSDVTPASILIMKTGGIKLGHDTHINIYIYMY